MVRPFWVLPAALALAVSGLVTNASQARSVSITVQNMSFIGGTRTVAQGTLVSWVFKEGPHTTTSRQRFWDSPRMSSEAFSFVFTSAGAYAYFCRVHPIEMTGTITVPVRATTITGGKRVQWSSVGSSSRSYDVQVKKPGSTRWVAFRTNTKALFKSFRPAKKGRYFFRARTHNLSNGKTSGWSPAKAVRVS